MGPALIHMSLYLFIIAMLNRQPIESKITWRKFGLTFPLKDVEAVFASRLKIFHDKIQLEQQRKYDEQMEMKRNEIFRQMLLSRVNGSVLKDFYSRF